MLLAIDVGNTNTVFGAFDGGRLVATLRAETLPTRPAGEFEGLLHKAFDLDGVTDVIIGSVVPLANESLAAFCRERFQKEPEVVTPANAGIEIVLDNPDEVGADRLINAAAVVALYKTPAIVVDFGTATTFDVIDAQDRYIGGAIAPGINLSLAALHAATAKLPQVAVSQPGRVIGKATIEAMQSGIYWGYIGLIEGLVARLGAEMGGNKPFVIATGGLAPLFAGNTPAIHNVDEHLTLKGLLEIHRTIHDKN
jgi:type III pantothenate kinase